MDFGNTTSTYLIKVDGTFEPTSTYDLIIKSMLVGTSATGTDCQIDLDNIASVNDIPTTEAPTTEISPVRVESSALVTNSEVICGLNATTQITDVNRVDGTYRQ